MMGVWNVIITPVTYCLVVPPPSHNRYTHLGTAWRGGGGGARQYPEGPVERGSVQWASQMRVGYQAPNRSLANEEECFPYPEFSLKPWDRGSTAITVFISKGYLREDIGGARP